MLKAIKEKIVGVLEDFGYSAKRSAAFIFGKGGGVALGQSVGLWAGGLLGTMAGLDGATGQALQAVTAMTLMVGAVAGVSGGLVQVDYKHRRHLLRERYQDEIGAVVGKKPEKVTEADMEKVARGDFHAGIAANPALREELKNETLKRNIGVVLSAVVAAATFLILHDVEAVAGALHDGAAMLSKSATDSFAFKTADFLLHGVAGLATYNVIKTPLHWAVGEMTGLETETVNDRVTEIKRGLARGHAVSQEQILEVFINAHPEVGEQIEAEFGKEYDRLPKQVRQEILGEVQKSIDIAGITESINHGRMKPEELAFSAYGQHSGCELKPEGSIQHHSTNILDGMWHALSSLTGGFTGKADHAAAAEHIDRHMPAMPGKTDYAVYVPDANTAGMGMTNVQEEPGRRQSFAAAVGRNVSDDGGSHVERLEQKMSQEVVVTR